MIWHVNWNAFALGVWAPAAEILLGWIYAAGLRSSVQPRSNRPTATRFECVGEAFTGRVERKFNDGQVNGAQVNILDNIGEQDGNGRSDRTRAEQFGNVQAVQTERLTLSKG